MFFIYRILTNLVFLFSPIIILIRLFNFLKILFTRKNYSSTKTICVGNIYLGGTGKTSLSLKINEILSQKKIKTCFIKKFYSNQIDEQNILEDNGKLFKNKKRFESFFVFKKFSVIL